METKRVEETHRDSGNDGVNGTSGSNISNKRVSAAGPAQQQHPSSSSSSSSISWPARSKNELPRNNISPESNNDSQKSFQFCRICHEGDISHCSEISPNTSQGSSSSRREPLIAPCRCTGSVAMVHLSCLEHWLTTSNSEKCELCNFHYKTKKMPRTWSEFLTESDNQFNVRNMIADLICFFLLTPLLVISTYLCCLGAHQYFLRERWEALGLVTLSIFLLAVYFTWCHVTLKYHYGVWETWVRTNQQIRITFGDGSFSEYCRRRVSPDTTSHQQSQQRANSRTQRTSSATFAMEEAANHRQNRNNNGATNHTSETTASSSTAASQFDYVNIPEEEDGYYNFQDYDHIENYNSTENLYIVNHHNPYNNRFPYNINRQNGVVGGTASVLDGNMLNNSVFSYHPVIVIPALRHNHHQRLLESPATSSPISAEPNFPVMGLSSFSTFRNPNSNSNPSDN